MDGPARHETEQVPLEGLLLRVPVGVREDLAARNLNPTKDVSSTYLYLIAIGITVPPSSKAYRSAKLS